MLLTLKIAIKYIHIQYNDENHIENGLDNLEETSYFLKFTNI